MHIYAKTVSRNVALKVAKMRVAIMEDQDEFLMRNSNMGHTEVQAWRLTTRLCWRM